MKKEIPSFVLYAAIGVAVVVVAGIGWYYLRPAPPERVPPRPAAETRTNMLLQRSGQGQQPGPGGQ